MLPGTDDVGIIRSKTLRELPHIDIMAPFDRWTCAAGAENAPNLDESADNEAVTSLKLISGPMLNLEDML